MQTKDLEKQTIDNSQNGDGDLNKNHRVQNYFPSIAIMLVGLFSMYSCYMSAYTFTWALTLYTPHGDKVESLFITLISVGIIYVLACIISSFLWTKGVIWSRYPIIVLAIIPTVALFFLFSIQMLFWIIVAVIIDAYLFKVMFIDPKRNRVKKIDP